MLSYFRLILATTIPNQDVSNVKIRLSLSDLRVVKITHTDWTD